MWQVSLLDPAGLRENNWKEDHNTEQPGCLWLFLHFAMLFFDLAPLN